MPKRKDSQRQSHCYQDRPSTQDRFPCQSWPGSSRQDCANIAASGKEGSDVGPLGSGGPTSAWFKNENSRVTGILANS